ncbi:uncharacterized protein LOC129608149 [Condylostylus longicornis]|uniref:uncharacterized protein LOC129608149 n=1 Tax=Condylostylus longicornis TaxID=2530218 RepID=UPI00244E1AA8|nr:uncharacterized protein LOC129608149 [Condylostylus longicornis]
MPKKAELKIETRATIIAEFNCGVSASEIAKKYNCDRRTVYYLVDKYKNHHNCENLPGRGRKRVTNKKDDTLICRSFKIYPRQTFKSALSNFNDNRENKVSMTTVRRRLKENGFKSYVIRKQPYITPKNREARLQFALEYKDKSLEY